MARNSKGGRVIFARRKLGGGKALLVALAAAVALVGIGGWAYILLEGAPLGKTEAEAAAAQGSGQGGVTEDGGRPAPMDAGVGALEPAAAPLSGSGLAEAGKGDISRFSSLYYYEEDKLDRYLAYEALHGELSAEEAVWQVNMKLDEAFYSDVALIENPDAIPTLVNKHNRLAEGYAPPELVEIRGGIQVTPQTKDAFLVMADAAKAEGAVLRPGSAYRTIAYQQGLYDRYKKADGEAKADSYSSRPGHSEHHTGRTLDLVAADGTLTNFSGTPEADWVAENAWKHGFIVRYTEENKEVTGYGGEPWHLTYVGKAAAMTMHNKGIGSLEEYFAKYVLHRQKH